MVLFGFVLEGINFFFKYVILQHLCFFLMPGSGSVFRIWIWIQMVPNTDQYTDPDPDPDQKH